MARRPDSAEVQRLQADTAPDIARIVDAAREAVYDEKDSGEQYFAALLSCGRSAIVHLRQRQPNVRLDAALRALRKRGKRLQLVDIEDGDLPTGTGKPAGATSAEANPTASVLAVAKQVAVLTKLLTETREDAISALSKRAADLAVAEKRVSPGQEEHVRRLLAAEIRRQLGIGGVRPQ